jgi:threonine aldolase
MPIDLRSDTVTRPSPAMREAMARAEVGDDVYGEDATVNRLQETVAALLGKEAALFVPSGTMANQIALRSLTEPGDAAIAPRDAHIQLYEGGGAAALSGVQFNQIGTNGAFTPDELRAAVNPADDHFARSRVVCVENTHNRSGGRIFPFEQLRAVTEAARARGLRLHLDGARIWNAAEASGISAAQWAAPFDTVSCCLSKGLGAPVGSVLAGSADLIDEARDHRKRLGGAMRQAGIVAAAGVYALDHHVERLADDHARAKRLAEGLAALPGVELDPATVQTNIVVFSVPDAGAFTAALAAEDIEMSHFGPTRVRAVTHLDVDEEGIERALAVAAQALQ